MRVGGVLDVCGASTVFHSTYSRSAWVMGFRRWTLEDVPRKHRGRIDQPCRLSCDHCNLVVCDVAFRAVAVPDVVFMSWVSLLRVSKTTVLLIGSRCRRVS